MIKLTHVSAFSLVATILAGCAVSAAPDAKLETSTDAENAAPRSLSPIPTPIHPICIPPLTPATGEWSCGSSGVRTGDKSVTTTAGYTNNCAGRVTVALTYPKCPPGPAEFDELTILGLDVASANCTQAYLDYTVTGASASTGVWSTIASGRVYGKVLSGGGCDLIWQASSLATSIASAAWSEIEVSADAYEIEPIFFDGRVLSLIEPVNVFIDASFVQ
jgi:hypothetical protein